MTARSDDHLGWAEPATPPGTALLLEVAEAVKKTYPNTARHLTVLAPQYGDIDRARRFLDLVLLNDARGLLPDALRARLEGAA